MEKADIEYLENCLKRTMKIVGIGGDIWYKSDETMISVATILDDEGCFRRTSDVIRFFEKPYHCEKEMQELIDDYDEEHVETGA